MAIPDGPQADVEDPLFSVHIDATGRVITVSGELDVSTAPILDDAVRSLNAIAPGDVTIDCAGLTFADSALENACVRIQELLMRTGHALRLVHVSERHAHMIAAGGLGDTLDRR